MSILICLLKFTQKANYLVTIVALLRVHWDFLANHATTLVDKLSLEIIFNGEWIDLHETLRLWETALTKDAVYLVVC